MRLPLLLALLAVPALAQAQAVGVFEPQPVDERYDNDLYINLSECDPAQTRQVEFRWNVQLESGFAFRSGVFKVFATNRQPTTTSGLAYCETEDDTANSLWAGQVGDDIPTLSAGTAGNGVLITSEFVTEAGRTCEVGGDLQIYVCVHYHPYVQGGGTAVDPTRQGLASGTLTLSTQSPQPPTLNSVRPGNERLEGNWTASDTGLASEWYRIIATGTAGPTPADPVPPTRSDDVQAATRGWVDQLVNGATYDVTVVGLSAAGNPSVPSNALSGSPIPADDFWDRYRAAGGQEEGGCAAGAAGPLALLGLAAAFARRRAGRRS
jgi:hypothetical protein